MVPRSLAIRVLTSVLSNREPLDQALAAVAAETAAENRAWLQEICAGTLRWKGRLDLALDSVALRKKPSGWLRKALLIATYQLIVQERTPAPIIVSETVAEIKRKEGEAPARFANAILRKIADHASDWRKMPFPTGASAAEAAGWASLPEWLWKKIHKDHGEAWAIQFATACLERPKIWVRAKNTAWHPDWAKTGSVQNSWESVEGGAIQQRSGFTEGEFIVQDISSQHLISECTKLTRSELPANARVLDLCAAPGGKSVGMQWNGFAVTATDRDGSRIALLQDTVKRVAPEITVISRERLAEAEPFDLVWVDAPCTGTGIIRRHPDVRWIRQEKDIASLRPVQEQLIKEGWSKVRSGGYLMYSVCSVLKEEGAGLVERVGLEKFEVRSWALCPQDEPYGDGFWGVLLKKN